MKRFILLLTFISSFIVYVFIQDVNAQANKLKFNYVFIVDISGSMEGKPSGSGNEKIFPRLKEVLKDFINEVDNATVFFYPFSGNVDYSQSKKFDIKSSSDKKDANDYIDGLIANGTTTHIYDSFIDVIKNVNIYKHENTKTGEKQITLYYLYTDGKNEGGSGNMQDLIDQYKLEAGKDQWIFYTTLGVDASLNDQNLINENKSENIRYIPEAKGKVSPIRLFHPVIPIFNFGNLKKSNQSSRVELFTITGKKALPPDLKIKIELEIKNLHDLGAGAKISPDEFTPSKEQTFTLQLVNTENINDGIYEDTLYFEPTEDYLYVIPNKIPVKFSYNPESIILLEPPSGESFMLKFEDITPQKKFDQKSISVKFNDQAVKLNEVFSVKYEAESNNPSDVLLGQDIIINDISQNSVLLDSKSKELLVKVIYSDRLKEGYYKGKLLIEGSDLIFSGDTKGLDSLKNNPSVKTIEIVFKINNPWPVWIKIIIIFIAILILLLLLWFGFLKKKNYLVFDAGELQISNSTDSQTVHLRGKTGINIGFSNKKQSTLSKIFIGEELNIADSTNLKVTLKPEIKDNTVWTKIIYDRNSVEVKRPYTGFLKHNEIISLENITDKSKKIKFTFLNIKNR